MSKVRLAATQQKSFSEIYNNNYNSNNNSNINNNKNSSMEINYNFNNFTSTNSSTNVVNTSNNYESYDSYNNTHNNNSNNSIISTTDDGNGMLHTAEVIGTILNLYYVPILVLAGSTGNILSVIVFFKTKLHKLTSSYYLAALAVSDTCFLLGLFAQWLNFMDINLYNRDYFCQFFTFFSSLACFCSVWFVVAFTVERFIAVMYPLKRQTMCTIRRAKMVLLGLTSVGCLHCAPFLFSSQVMYSPKLGTSICDIKTEYKEYITLFNYWDSFVIFALPFMTIVILNTITGCRVWKFGTLRRSLTMQKNFSVRRSEPLSLGLGRSSLKSQTTYRITTMKGHKSCSFRSSGHNGSERLQCGQQRGSGKQKLPNSSQLKVTKMLLIVSTVFICLNLPSCVVRIKTYLETNTSANEKATVVLQYIFQLLFITNFGINFVLYCVSGQNFRKAVSSMFRRKSMSHREGTRITEGQHYDFNGLAWKAFNMDSIRMSKVI